MVNLPDDPDTNSAAPAQEGGAPEQQGPQVDKPHGREKNLTPVIGIGSSAGGLEALEQFFTGISETSGAAFVVIQHLDPNQLCMLPEILGRFTSMKTIQAGDGEKITPNCIYVTPPNKDLSILNGKLHLIDPVAPRGLRLPIDYFFRALANDRRERAIGVILSGMGSDGTLGLRAIKENAGLSLAQLPDSAKFEAMPRSVIDAGLADIIAPPRELAARILNYLTHSLYGTYGKPDSAPPHKAQSALEKIVVLLRDRTGNDFSQYKKNTIYRRIERRMGLQQIDGIDTYVSYLNKNPQEIELLFKELLIGVTKFFRDPEIWEKLGEQLLPALLSEFPGGKELRAWVPACSTGEEAFSLAMVFKEVLTRQKLQHQFKLQIFATDLDEDAIEIARTGIYPANIVADVSPERLNRFFTTDNNGYRINKDIREMVIFARQNIIMDPPFTKLDMLSCRNLLIYLSPELQKKLIPLFHYALSNHGVLLLGNSESISNFSSLFADIDGQSRLYRRIERPLSPADVDFPIKYFPASAASQAESRATKPITNLQGLMDQLILQNYAPPAVVINAEGDILYINGRTGKYLEPAAGKANWNIYVMARDGLRHELAEALKKAKSQTEPVFLSGLTVGTNGGQQTVNVIVQAILKPETLNNLLIVIFQDVAVGPTTKPSRKPPSALQKAMQAELQQAREDMQTIREEMQTSQEELKSANEELQSTNEELQSTNEELTTSKEEMQSLNEELQTMNAELQSKVNDLSWINNDMNNLLNSMEIPTVFLDNALNIRRFTSHATHLFKLIGSDVGRPLSDIATDLEYPDLQANTKTVLSSLVYSEKRVKTHSGNWFRVKIMPYRTQDNVIDGVVITFIDITETKNLEAQLRQNLQVSDEQSQNP